MSPQRAGQREHGVSKTPRGLGAHVSCGWRVGYLCDPLKAVEGGIASLTYQPVRDA